MHNYINALCIDFPLPLLSFFNDIHDPEKKIFYSVALFARMLVPHYEIISVLSFAAG